MNEQTKIENQKLFYKSTINLASLLNDPRKIKRDYDLFTKDWGDTFKDLPKGAVIKKSKYVRDISLNEFTKYISSTKDRLVQHQSLTKKSLLDEMSISSTSSSNCLLLPQCVDCTNVICKNSTNDAIKKTRKALQSIPEIFVSSAFTIENPKVFHTIMSLDSSINKTTEISTVHSRLYTSLSLQEKLSHYLDMVEIALVKQISLQSEAFFKAMTSHELLHDDLEITLKKVQNILSQIRCIDRNVVKSLLKVTKSHRLRTNSWKLVEKLQMMATVRQTQPTIQLLLSTNEYAGALDLIHTTQDILLQELSGLNCFRHLSSQLKEMERVIGMMMRKDMEQLIKEELNQSLCNTNNETCRNPHRVTAVTLGLLKHGQFDFLQGFREEVKEVIKQTIASTINTSLSISTKNDVVSDIDDDSLTSQQHSHVYRIRSLPFADWLHLLGLIFENLIKVVNFVRSVLQLILNLTIEHCNTLRRMNSIKSCSRKKSNNKKCRKRKPQLNKHLNGSCKVSEKKDACLNPFGGIEEITEFPTSLNPFGDVEEESINSAEYVMEGLASYEDELLTNLNVLPRNCSINSLSSSNGHEVNDTVKFDIRSSESEDYSDVETEKEEDIESHHYDMKQLENLFNLIYELFIWTCEFQQDRCVKLILAKNKNGSVDKITSNEFMSLAKLVNWYTHNLENMVNSMYKYDKEHKNLNHVFKKKKITSSLRGTLKTQAGRFVSRFHEDKMANLTDLLKTEMWKQADVSSYFQNILQCIVEKKEIQQKTTNSVSDEVSKHIIVDQEKFPVASVTLMLLKMIYEYCKCSDEFPNSMFIVITNLCELLKYFNDTTGSLLLMAKILDQKQQLGLRKINAAHLALASRSLQLILRCLPYVRENFEKKLLQSYNREAEEKHKNTRILLQFDVVKQKYEDHVQKIESKLVDIAQNMVNSKLSSWKAVAPVPSQQIKSMVEQLKILYKLLSPLLPDVQLCMLFERLNSIIKCCISKKINLLGISNNGGPQHGLVNADLAHYATNINKLGVIKTVDLQLNTVWNFLV